MLVKTVAVSASAEKLYAKNSNDIETPMLGLAKTFADPANPASFAQPLVRLGSLEMGKENAMVNNACYAAVDFLTWQG